jgi:DNA-binding transcriptional ArsR family regulator
MVSPDEVSRVRSRISEELRAQVLLELVDVRRTARLASRLLRRLGEPAVSTMARNDLSHSSLTGASASRILIVVIGLI